MWLKNIKRKPSCPLLGLGEELQPHAPITNIYCPNSWGQLIMNPLKRHRIYVNFVPLQPFIKSWCLETVTYGGPSDLLLYPINLCFPVYMWCLGSAEMRLMLRRASGIQKWPYVLQSELNHSEPQTETPLRGSCGDQERWMLTRQKVLVVGGLAQTAKYVGNGRLVLSAWEETSSSSKTNTEVSRWFHCCWSHTSALRFTALQSSNSEVPEDHLMSTTALFWQSN